MINIEWLESLLDTVADHGRELIGMKEDVSDYLLCQRLMAGKGEATNIALAREILQRWQGKDEAQKRVFLTLLEEHFGYDKAEIERQIAHYDNSDPKALTRLLALAEAPRQELFRRLNMAPNGTAILVDMRTFLLNRLAENAQLKAVDNDFKHLLGSWFNRGFLRLEKIDWSTSAAVLEKLIEHEAVHPMQGWSDLRRRLNERDRRCFAFFHPALPKVPLIFIEVALTNEISDSIEPLVDPQASVSDLQPDTAVFYSINNALVGLRGVSFGNFLIKQVAEELKGEFAGINRFVTLSPIPGMVKSLQAIFDEETTLFDAMQRDSILRDIRGLITFEDKQVEGVLTWGKLEAAVAEDEQALQRICLYYLAMLKRKESALDPVAHFHLSNGAYLHRINLTANTSARGKVESWGCMVNYLYESEKVVENHEAYVCAGEVALSKDLQRIHKQVLNVIKKS